MTNKQINTEVAQQLKEEKCFRSLKVVKDSYEEVIERIYIQLEMIETMNAAIKFVKSLPFANK